MAEETTENSYLQSMLSQIENADISNPAAMKVKMLLDMLPSEDKSAGENIFDIVSMHPGIAGAKVAEPILEMMTPAMRGA
jgi:hypothetical protein